MAGAANGTMWDSASFLGALTPKFYVALTGTSSLISGLILVFEWWYFRKYGTSFIEQVSLGLGGAAAADAAVGRNPLALLRGAEYARLWAAARRPPLTYYDMNLSAQDHQAWFAPVGETGADEAMSRAWREREPGARVAAARAALRLRPDCAAALLLLAEEDAPTVLEAERVLKRAWRAAEAAWRAQAALGGGAAPPARRAAALLAHIKRRAALCARRLGRLRDAARLLRELAREGGAAGAGGAVEPLLEVLLELRQWGEAAALVARCGAAQRSAAVLYSAALLAARAGGAGGAEAGAAMAAAVEYNPFVPEYLLELRALTLPPEHVLRRGDSEAVAYAFAHLRHWRRAPAALDLLADVWPGRVGRYSGAGCLGCADRELLPPAHEGGAGGALLPLGAALAAALAAAAARWGPAALASHRLTALLHAPD